MSKEVQCNAESPCTAVQLLTQRLVTVEELIEKMGETLEKIQNRLPPWVMGAAWVTGLVIGVLGTLVAVAWR